MLKVIHRVKIQHSNFGVILDEQFIDGTQFKLFLKMLNASFDDNEGLRFFNGVDFFLNIPSNILKDCIVFTKIDEIVAKSDIVKSKIEALETI